MLLQSTLLCVLLLIRVDAAGKGVPSPKTLNPSSKVTSAPDAIEPIDPQVTVLHGVIGLGPPEPINQSGPLMDLQHQPSDQGEEYEELPKTCCDYLLCRKGRLVHKNLSPRYSVTASGRHPSRTISLFPRQTSDSTNTEGRRNTASASLPRSTTSFGVARPWSFLKRTRSSSTEGQKAAKTSPPTSRHQSTLEPPVPRSRTQPNPNGKHHAPPGKDTSVDLNSGQQDVSGRSLELSMSTTVVQPGQDQGQV